MDTKCQQYVTIASKKNNNLKHLRHTNKLSTKMFFLLCYKKVPANFANINNNININVNNTNNNNNNNDKSKIKYAPFTIVFSEL